MVIPGLWAGHEDGFVLSFILVSAVLGRPKGLTDLKHGPPKHTEGFYTSFLGVYKIQAHRSIVLA